MSFLCVFFCSGYNEDCNTFLSLCCSCEEESSCISYELNGFETTIRLKCNHLQYQHPHQSKLTWGHLHARPTSSMLTCHSLKTMDIQGWKDYKEPLEWSQWEITSTTDTSCMCIMQWLPITRKNSNRFMKQYISTMQSTHAVFLMPMYHQPQSLAWWIMMYDEIIPKRGGIRCLKTITFWPSMSPARL